jgi:tetratricopeptide (TPR) repeat protein
LGFHLGAVCFFDHAYAIEPKPVYAVSALESLSRASMKQAVVRAKEIAERPIVEGTLLLEAASVLHRGVLLVPPEARTAVYEEVVRITEAAWTDTTALPSIRATGLIAAGYSYEHLGRDADARLQFERAATIYPSEPALLAYGLSVLALDRRKALDHITRAAREGTRFDWPYVFATSHALELGRFAEAEHFAEAGIARTENDEVLGRLYEWSAIAAARLGRQTPIVIERFDRALAALPLDPTIQKNAAAFIEFATNQDWLVVAPPAPPSWEEMEKAAA